MISVADRMEAACAKNVSSQCEKCKGTITITKDDFKEVEDLPKEERQRALIDLAGAGGAIGCDCDVETKGNFTSPDATNGTITCKGRDGSSLIPNTPDPTF